MMAFQRWLLAPAVVLLTGWLLAGADPTPKTPPQEGKNLPDLSGFRTVDKAVTTTISLAAPTAPTQPAYLGVHLDPDKGGRLVVAHVESDSPAAAAGVKQGDVIQKVAGEALKSVAQLKELLQAKSPGDALKIAVLRKDQPVELTAKLGATSRPLSRTAPRAIMGVQAYDTPDGLRIERVTEGFPAEKAGVKRGDIVVKVDGTKVTGFQHFGQILDERNAGDTVTLALKRDGKDVEAKVTLVAERTRGGRRGNWDNRRLGVWKKGVYRLAVVAVEFPDVTHNDKVSPKEWEKALFTRGTYTDKSPTGQKVYGSLNDYYLEQSCDTFHVEGKVFDYVKVGKKRAEYANSRQRFALFTEALDKLLDRDGEDALKDYDGLFFLYAGNAGPSARGGIYWPHRSSVRYKGKLWPYIICPEGGRRMASISVVAHEFGHLLGLPDLYAQSAEVKGLGVWCTMSTGHGQDGKPLHFSAWCKERLGWIKPTVIDPRVKQKLILSPIEKSSKECYKVLLQPDGSEYLLLENRVARGFDRDLPGQGMLIWRVVNGRPILEESHGINGPDGPQRFLGSIPYPSRSNTAYTPRTTPSSKPLKGGGLPVHITNIRKLPDGRITFFIGYEYL
jgi:M6 family metalloprotease-like protein